MLKDESYYTDEDILDKTQRRGGIENIPNEITRHEKEIERLKADRSIDNDYIIDLGLWVIGLKRVYEKYSK